MSKIKYGKIKRVEEKPAKKKSDYDQPNLEAERKKRNDEAFRESVTRYTTPEEYLKRQDKKVKF